MLIPLLNLKETSGKCVQSNTMCPLNNYIEKEIFDAYSPLFIFQSVLLIPPFCVNSGFLTPVDKTCNTKTLFGICMHIIARIIYFSGLYDQFTRICFIPSIIYMAVMNTITYCISVICIYFVNIVQSHNAIQILLKLRKALLIMHIEKQEILKDYKIWNNVCIISLLWFNLAMSVMNVARNRRITSIFGILGYVVFDLQLICAFRTISLGASILASWNRKMMICTDGKYLCVQREDMKSMLEAYVNIINVFGLCNQMYQCTILYEFISLFFNFLYYVEISLSTIYNQGGNKILPQLAIFTWSFKSALVLAILSAACERFYRNVRVSGLVCARALTLDGHTNVHGETRRTCKNVVRYNRSVFRRLSVFGACAVDATMPLRLLLIVGSYTVVLLQFSLSS